MDKIKANPRSYYLSLILMTMGMMVGFSQQKTVTGNITDENGLPLPGATVVEQGTDNGTTTDFDGNYTITVKENAKLEISFVGYSKKEIQVGNDDVISTSLSPDSNLEEVIVTTAYGTQRKISVVGAITSISNEILENQQSTSIGSSIQGSVPGVNILTSGGVPGTNPQLWIRGVGSINADPNPLYIVDGSPFNGNTNVISQEQVSKISVLKDASATALYGARGANGVVIIETKKGKLNTEAKIIVTSKTGISDNAIQTHRLLSGEQNLKMTWEAMKNKFVYTDEQSPETAAQNATNGLISRLAYNPYDKENPIDTNGNLVAGAKQLWDTNWEDVITRKSGIRSEHGVSLEGGGEKTTYYFNVNYLNEQGQVKKTGFERMSSRLSLDSQIKDWLRIGAISSYTDSKSGIPSQEGTSYQSLIQWIYTVPSIYPVYRRDANGKFILDAGGNKIFDYGDNKGQVNASRPALSGENAWGALNLYDVNTKVTHSSFNGYASFRITDFLNFRSSVAYERFLVDAGVYAHNKYGYAASVGGRVTKKRDLGTNINFIQSLNFIKDFGKHLVEADLIHESYGYEFETLNAQGVGFLPGVKVLSGSTKPESVSGSVSEERIIGYLGRLRYSFDDRFFLEGTYRRDGSSRFKKEVRWGDFYAIGGAYVMSKEKFFNSNSINFLKIKASYGNLGNNRGIGYFPYLQLYSTGWNQGENTGVLADSPRDENIGWEKTASMNLGFELNMFDDRLQGEVNYYEKNSVDLIYDKPLAPSTGNTSIKTNEGALRNYGIEVSLGGKLIEKENLDWEAEFNFSVDRNEITELTQKEFINGSKKWMVGKSLYDFFIQEYAGVDPEDGSAMWYKDEKDDDGKPTGKRITTKDYDEADRYYYDKRSIPDLIGGISSRLYWKNFDFSFKFNYSFGGYLYDSTYASLMNSFESAGRQGHVDLLNRWQKPGDKTDIPKLTTDNNDYNARSTRFLFKNDYIRLRDIVIGYKLNKQLTENWGIDYLRVYLQGRNLFTYQSIDGIDAEQSISGLTNSRSYLLRTISLGLRIKL